LESVRRSAPRGGRIRSESAADFVGIRTPERNTLHERRFTHRRRFTRKRSGSAIAAKAFMNNAGNPPGQLPEADLVLPNVEGVRPESIDP